MQDRIIKLSEMNFEKLNVITLTESGGLMGEIVGQVLNRSAKI